MNEHQRSLDAKYKAFLGEYMSATPEERRRFHGAIASAGVSFDEAKRAMDALGKAWINTNAGRPVSPRGNTGRTRA
ncbi:MAG: hypothetical protein ACIAQF_08125 [Phycisphaerales bacterium JB065]